MNRIEKVITAFEWARKYHIPINTTPWNIKRPELKVTILNDGDVFIAKCCDGENLYVELYDSIERAKVIAQMLFDYKIAERADLLLPEIFRAIGRILYLYNNLSKEEKNV